MWQYNTKVWFHSQERHGQDRLRPQGLWMPQDRKKLRHPLLPLLSRPLCVLQPSLAKYDPFFRQKGAALTKSMTAAAEIAVTLQQLLQQQADATAAAGGDKQQQVDALLGAEARDRMYQLVQVCASVTAAACQVAARKRIPGLRCCPRRRRSLLRNTPFGATRLNFPFQSTLRAWT
jgi:hypothetical protein